MSDLHSGYCSPLDFLETLENTLPCPQVQQRNERAMGALALHSTNPFEWLGPREETYDERESQP